MPDLIETVRIRGGVAPLWYLHLRRLAGSCKALGVPLPGELPTPSGGADRVHRIQVGSRGATVSERLPHLAYALQETPRLGLFERKRAEALRHVRLHDLAVVDGLAFGGVRGGRHQGRQVCRGNQGHRHCQGYGQRRGAD